MSALLLVTAAILCNVGAQLALKTGAPQESAPWEAWLSPALALGLTLYGVSFYLTIRIYALYPLSIISPIMAGAIFMLVSLGAALLFGETLSWLKLLGISIIVLGIAVLARAA